MMGRRPDRRHLQRRASRSRTAGRTRCRASRRSGCGSPRARPTACGRGSRSSPACCTTGAGCRSSSASTTGTSQHERYLRNEAPLARVALLHSEQTATVSPGRGRRAIAPQITCSACTTRWSRRACRSSWSTRRCSRPIASIAFKLLILADAAALSDAQCAAIREYVERGGSVLATFATSLYDETGGAAERLRPGRPVRRRLRRPHRRSDAELVPEPRCRLRSTGQRHPVLDGLRATRRASSTACSASA